MRNSSRLFTFLVGAAKCISLFWCFGHLIIGCSGGLVTYTEPGIKKESTAESKIFLKIKHFSQDSTTVYAALRTEDVYFAPTQNTQSFWCSFKFVVTVADKSGNKLHTSEQSLSLSREKVTDYVVFSMSVPMLAGEHRVDVLATDLNSNRTFRAGTKTDKNAENTVLTLTIASGAGPVALPQCPVGTEIFITAGTPQINVTYISQIPLPPAPFSADKPTMPEKWKPETTGQMSTLDGSAKISLGSKGLFLFRSEIPSSATEPILATAAHYPDVRKIEELILSARYIMTKAEFDEIISSKDVKKKFDSFWLTNAGSKEKARSMIRTYYNRVITANTLFTCHKEGWQTDRGMIFIVLGPPVNIQSDPEKEIWTYPRSGLPGNDEFRFLKTHPDFDNNHFELVRSPDYKPIWMANVESWRSGRTN